MSGFHPGGAGSRPPTQDLWGYLPLQFLLIPSKVHVAMINFKARTVTKSVSLCEISLIVRMIKDYVIVTIVYLNAFYRKDK